MNDNTFLYRLVRGVGGNYWVHDQNRQEIQVQAPGIFRKNSDKPLVGDLLVCENTGDDLIPLRMKEIVSRKNTLPRPAIANVDELWLIIPLAEPEPDLWVLDKMLVIANYAGIDCRIIFTKEDLLGGGDCDIPGVYKSLEYDICVSSPEKNELFELLGQDLCGKLVALAGPSGAGKSTLLNAILGVERMETGSISEKWGRGKHTTRHTELFYFSDSYIADTPGFSSLDLFQAGVTEMGLVQAYPEIWDRQNDCRFLSCKHLNEPGCAVRENKEIDQGRLERYQEFRRQLEKAKSYERKSYR